MRRLLLLLVLLLARPACADGGISFPAEAVHRSNADTATTNALRTSITRSWDRWLHLDAAAYGACLTPDVTRMSQHGSGLERGRGAVLAALPLEWSAFERPGGVIAERLQVRGADLYLHDSSHAVVSYWIEVRGGARWSYDDLGLVWQAWTRDTDGRWRIAHQIDAWGLDYDVTHRIPGRPGFAFDFVYPVHDLPRATAFYSGLLGPPERIEPARVCFSLKGARFFLEPAGRVAQNRTGLPNGYAIIYVPDIDAERQRLIGLGVHVEPIARHADGDRSAMAFDPAGNALLLWQRVRSAGSGMSKPRVRGLDGAPAARAIIDAWLQTDTVTLERLLTPAARWFDASESRTFGIEDGRSAILASLDRHYWNHYDRKRRGLLLTATASAVATHRMGAGTVVSFRLRLKGTGPHPDSTHALVTMLFGADTKLQDMWVVGDAATATQAMELDYSGYPQVDLEAAARFYGDVLKLGKPYRDSGYRGWWGERAVFGVYRARPQRDHVPVAGRANGYMSFWIRSAADTLRWLKAHGARFPVIPAINAQAGIDEEPGYRQIYATDSEGNGVVFSEYTGKRR